ncbi:MAG: hypothetical protein HY064_13210 [Bacteroidetes bacterium]|nr:hypothetical protein [Bacteroidota bacterium]
MRKDVLKVILAAPLFYAGCVSAQPYIDIVNFNSQAIYSTYKDSAASGFKAFDQNFGFFAPVNIDSNSTVLLKFTAEELSSTRLDCGVERNRLYSFALPAGYQLTSKNRKWKMMGMIIPRLSSDLRGKIADDLQLGGTFLLTWQPNEKFSVKAGLYYNKEFFGNFFVPLLGVDWRPADRWRIFGLLPNNMRVEYKLGQKVYCGVAYKNYQRSYQMQTNLFMDSVHAKESEAKFFLDFYVKQKLVLFIDAGYSLKYSFVDRVEGGHYCSPNPYGSSYDGIYDRVNNNFVFTIGLAYRIRLDEPKIE